MTSKTITTNREVADRYRYTRADIWLFLTIAAYFIMNGAQLWETALMIPAWTQAPPASLIFFQPPYGLDFKVFWIVLHSVHEVIFILALIFNWNIQARRMPLLLLFLLHIAVRVWTIAYFAQEIIDFQQIPYSDSIDAQLVERAAHWRNLNYLRVGLFFSVNIALVFLFRYPSVNHEK